MIAAQLQHLKTPFELVELPLPAPAKDEVLVNLKAAALNKRDYWITQGKYPGITFPLIPGSDGTGLVADREVIINPGLGWGTNPAIFDTNFRILGLPEPGTLAEWVKVPAINIFDKPGHLTWAEAAALPVCGVTAYRAMVTRGKAKAQERMLVTGIGGGVASMALLFGVALGLEVWVTSSSEAKIEMAISLGAAGGANYANAGWEKDLAEQVQGRFDLMIDGAGGSGFANCIPLMNPGGRMVIYGGTQGAMDGLSPQRIFWKQLDILGSTMGSPDDFKGMLDLVNQYKIKPVVSHIFTLQEINEAMAVMAQGDQFGKICIDLARG